MTTTAALDEQQTIRRAAALMNADQLDQAESLLQTLCQAMPQSAPALYSLGMLRLRRGASEEAASLFSQAVAADPRHVRSYVGLGQARARLGDQQGARHCFMSVLDMEPDNALARKALASLDTPPTPGTQTGSQVSQTPQVPTVSGLLETMSSFDEEGLRGAVIAHWSRRLSSQWALYVGGVLIVAAAVPGLAANSHDRLDAVTEDALNSASRTSAVALALVGVGLVVFAALSTASTRYVYRERAVDITSGVLLRRQRTVWLWDVVEVDMQRNPFLMLARTGRLVLFSGTATPVVGRKPRSHLVGFASAQVMTNIRVELQTRALHERRAMKKQWI